MIPQTLSSTIFLGLITKLATMALVSGEADHFILTHIPTIAMARMDPIVNNGEVSSHVHNIMGGSNFHQTMNSPGQQTGADCSSAIVGADMSSYWAPLLYYKYPNGTMAPMLGQNRIYYFLKNDEVKPFPPGLRMISGTAMNRNSSDPKSKGVMISCNHGEQTQYLPNGKTNPGGCQAIAMGIYFPSCGLASGDLDSPDHFSHMAWPQMWVGNERVDHVNGYMCPESHPIKYPTIFMEANYYTGFGQPWRNDEELLVLSNGDTTGLTYHADFFNGWDQQVLTDTIKNCGNGKAPGDQLKQCAPLAKTTDIGKAYACRYQNQLPSEDIGLYKPISKLPGCNPLWTASMGNKKPTCEEKVEAPGFASPNVFFENLLYRMHIPLTASWAPENSTGLQSLIPGLGMLGASKIKAWGDSGGVNDDSLRVGSLVAIKDAAVGPSGNSTVAASGSSTAASATGSATASGAPVSNSSKSSSSAGSGAALNGNPQVAATTAAVVTDKLPGVGINLAVSSTSASESPSASAPSHSSSSGDKVTSISLATSTSASVSAVNANESSGTPTTREEKTATMTKGPAKTCVKRSKRNISESEPRMEDRAEAARQEVKRHLAQRGKRGLLRH